MNPSDTPTTIELNRAQFVRLPHPRGVQVASRRGTLWITIDGERDDIELEAGECFAFPADAPALIGVLGPSAEVVLRQQRRAAVPWWRRALAGAG